MCARSRHCVFQDDKKVYCYKHRHLISGRVSSALATCLLLYQFKGLQFDARLLYHLFSFVAQMITGQEFEVNRRVYVDFEGISRRKFLTGLEPELINLMIGKHLSFSWFPLHSLTFTDVSLHLINILGIHIVTT